jgi:hypothetical protein
MAVVASEMAQNCHSQQPGPADPTMTTCFLPQIARNSLFSGKRDLIGRLRRAPPLSQAKLPRRRNTEAVAFRLAGALGAPFPLQPLRTLSSALAEFLDKVV